MARTPLLRALSRLLVAGRAGAPILEHAARERQERATSRRNFLALSAGFASIPILAACRVKAPSADGAPTIAIVGGGLAGLHCAYRLRKLGIFATVHEAGRRVGGRVFTDRTTFPEGMHCELGGELTRSRCRAV